MSKSRLFALAVIFGLLGIGSAYASGRIICVLDSCLLVTEGIAAVILVRTIEASGAGEQGRPECTFPECLLLYKRRAGVPPPLKV